MKFGNIISRLISFFSFLLIGQLDGHAQVADSVRLLMHNEIDFIEEHIKKTSVDPYRGLSVIEWDSTIKEIHDLVDKCQSKREYLLCLRRFGAIINDGHEVFPEEGRA